MSVLLVERCAERWIADLQSKNPKHKKDALAALQEALAEPDSVPLLEIAAAGLRVTPAQVLIGITARAGVIF